MKRRTLRAKESSHLDLLVSLSACRQRLNRLRKNSVSEGYALPIVPAPDFQSGGAGFNPRKQLIQKIRGFSPGGVLALIRL